MDTVPQRCSDKSDALRAEDGDQPGSGRIAPTRRQGQGTINAGTGVPAGWRGERSSGSTKPRPHHPPGPWSGRGVWVRAAQTPLSELASFNNPASAVRAQQRIDKSEEKLKSAFHRR